MNHSTHTTTRKLGATTRPVRLGLTLTELLVVIVILMILASMTVSTLRPTMQGAQVREAARVLSSTFSTTLYRAQRNSRPAGLMFEPLETRSGRVSISLVPVEEPPPYGGDTTGAAITFTNVTLDPENSQLITVTATISGGRSLGDLVTAGVISDGDRLQLNYRGHTFLVTGTSDGSNSMTLTSRAHDPRWPATNSSAKFLFYRRPRPSSVPAVQLPDGAVVDLTVSGGGNDAIYNPNVTTPVIVMFSPSGRVDRVFHPNAPTGESVNMPLQFLVGRIDQVASGGVGTSSKNLGDLNNRWVTVNAQTGMVNTYEMASVYADPNNPTERLTNPTITTGANGSLSQARKFMRRERKPTGP